MVQPMTKSLQLRGIARIAFLELENGLFHICRHHKEKQRMLVCRDGDFSFAASIATQIAEKGMHLTATVLESESNHPESKHQLHFSDDGKQKSFSHARTQ